MRYDAQHKQRTREQLLKAAARSIRRDGAAGVSVAAVMGEAGLTHGGFYAHFKSRDDLIAEGVAQMFREGAGRMARSLEGRDPREAVLDYIAFYLSPEHREMRTEGCPLPFLAGEVARLPEAAQAQFAQGVRGMETQLAALLAALGRPEPADDAASLIAELVGALALARAEPDPVRAGRLLAGSRDRIARRLGLDVADAR